MKIVNEELDEMKTYDRFYYFWQRASEILTSSQGSLTQRIMAAWTRAICCITIDDVPVSHREAFIFVRNALVSYRMSSRWIGDVANEMPAHFAESLSKAILELAYSNRVCHQSLSAPAANQLINAK